MNFDQSPDLRPDEIEFAFEHGKVQFLRSVEDADAWSVNVSHHRESTPREPHSFDASEVHTPNVSYANGLYLNWIGSESRPLDAPDTPPASQ